MVQGFFSYARDDTESDIDGFWVDKVETGLATHIPTQSGCRGFTLWRDRRALLIGDRWEAKLEAALDASACLIVLLTPCWLDSAWCKREYDRFTATYPNAPVCVLRFRDTEDTPLRQRLSQHQDIDLTGLATCTEPEARALLKKTAEDIAQKLRPAQPTATPPEDPPATPTARPLGKRRQLVSGHFDMPGQDSAQVLVHLGFSGRVWCKLPNVGRVSFEVRAASLYTEVSHGAIESVTTAFGTGHNPPRVSVTDQPAGRRKHFFNITSERAQGGLDGAVLRNKGEGGPVPLMVLKDAEDAPLEITGEVEIDPSAVHIHEVEKGCEDPGDQHARSSQLDKIAERILKKHGATYALEPYKR